MPLTQTPRPAPARATRPTRRPGTAMPALARSAPVAGTGPVAAAASWMRRAALARVVPADWPEFDLDLDGPAPAVRLPLLRPVW